MGMGIWPVFNPTADFTPDLDGKILLDEAEVLDELAERLGLSPFTSFADMREVPEGFDGDPDELAEVLGPWEEWFDISHGIKTLSALVDAIGAPQHAALFESPEGVTEDLLEIVRCLQRALPSGRKFRLELLS